MKGLEPAGFFISKLQKKVKRAFYIFVTIQPFGFKSQMIFY